jgi:PD-(D/E)XK nuclease superfamily protein
VELSTDQKGAIAETALVHAAAKLCIPVYAPVSEGGRYDLIFDVGSRLLRVQCKWATRRGDVILIRFRSSRRSRNGLVHRSYTTDEIDVIAGYCAELDQCYVIPFAEFFRRSGIYLRLGPTRNNQRQGILWARDFEFERLHWAGPGAIAQLGERQRGTLEVAGSIPAGSIESARISGRSLFD